MGRTILVADDSPTIQKKASGILTGEGLDVVTVSNGVAAVKKLPTVNPLVVLADVSMPGKDGYEVCEHIKSNASLAHISVLLVFSDTDPYEEAKGARVSADGRIKKPFDRDDLVSTVAKFVAQSEAALAPKVAPKAATPPAAFEVQPMDEEPEVAARQEAPDLSAFSGGVAFGVPTVEEIPSTPADVMTPEPMSAEPLPAVEEPPAVSSEAVEAMAAMAPAAAEESPALATAEPEVEIAPPEPAATAVEPMLVEETAAAQESMEDAGERTMMFRAPADIAQPILKDEVEVEAPPAEPEVAVATPVEEPAELAPVAEAPPVEEAPVAAGPAVSEAPAVEEASDVTPAEGTPIPSQTLESYTLTDAAAGHVRFGEPETGVIHEPDREIALPEPEPEPPAPEPPARVAAEPEVTLPEPVTPAAAAPPEIAQSEAPSSEAPAPEAVAAPPEEPAAPAPAEVAPRAKTVDEAQVFSIVHKVVLKMSPPALSPQMIEDIARRFADEITAELKSES
ncbi:MAG TPA: response regulator [Terriglobia bacterium]|nr:response regulator [Terriglobia bacterium]